MIGVVDYGMGNLHSVSKALEALGAQVGIVAKPGELKACDKLVLPGVGAFDDAMQELTRTQLADPLKEYARSGKPLLGICLGMQLFFETSEEARTHKGLGILEGEVVRFQPHPGLKVPHMGWNRLDVRAKECMLFRDVPAQPYVYFCHSYYVRPRNTQVTAAVAEYGGEFTCVVWDKNVWGVQFHPEKSQDAGMRMLKNFVACRG